MEARAGQAAVNPVIASLLRHLAADGGPATVRVPELDPLGQVRGLHTALRQPHGREPQLGRLQIALPKKRRRSSAGCMT
ncbi:MAG TPA: hypothetical protein VE979_01990 [Streptosporangiaceae bacterium]|nr:hypothetical protein [Streptosporangiaceae bacterium]